MHPAKVGITPRSGLRQDGQADMTIDRGRPETDSLGWLRESEPCSAAQLARREFLGQGGEGHSKEFLRGLVHEMKAICRISVAAMLSSMVSMTMAAGPNAQPSATNSALPNFVRFDSNSGALFPFEIIDGRDSESRLTELRQSKEVTYVRYGDDIVSPSPPEILASALQGLMSERVAGKKIELDHFFVEVFTKEDTIADTNSSPFYFVSNPKAPVAANALAAGLLQLLRSLDRAHAVAGSGFRMEISVHIIGRMDGREFYGDVHRTLSRAVAEDDIRDAVNKALKECAWRIDGSRQDSKFR